MKTLKQLLFSVLILITLFHPNLQASSNLTVSESPQPCTIVIFGATGDLTARKLIPAIYNLDISGNLSENTAIIGFARGHLTTEAFREKMGEAINQFSRIKPTDAETLSHFEKKLFFTSSSFEEDDGYEKLKQHLIQIDSERGTQGNRIFYLSTQPSYFPLIIEKLTEHNLIYSQNTPQVWSRVIIEKPFGTDLDSAITLQKHISTHLEPNQAYRMDHYLGKEGVRNLLALRSENPFLESFWNNQYIDNIQITLSEEIGIGTRAQFWEETGALRDVFQNHLMQLLSITAMELPTDATAESIHQAKIQVLNDIRPLSITELDTSVIRGQYGPGTIKGVTVPGYKEETGVSASSRSETFIAAKLFIDNERWAGVPFYIRGGKRLPKQTTEIVITFKSAAGQTPGILFIRIQPNPSIFFRSLAKVPGLESKIEPIKFGFNLESYFKKSSPEAYEKLFYDGIRGDSSLFVQAEEQLASWRLVTPLLKFWQSKAEEQLDTYDAGTWGPAAAEKLLSENGHQWQLFEN